MKKTYQKPQTTVIELPIAETSSIVQGSAAPTFYQSNTLEEDEEFE